MSRPPYVARDASAERLTWEQMVERCTVQTDVMWAGIDVGGMRKGFDVAIVSEDAVSRYLKRMPSATEVVGALLAYAGASQEIAPSGLMVSAMHGWSLRFAQRGKYHP